MLSEDLDNSNEYQEMIIRKIFHSTIWFSTLAIPIYVGAISIVILFLQVLLVSKAAVAHHDIFDVASTSRHQAQRDTAPLPNLWIRHITHHGGGIIFTYKIARLLGCLALPGLSAVTINERTKSRLYDEAFFGGSNRNPWGVKSFASSSETEWLEVALCIIFIYVSLLAVSSVLANSKWSAIVTRHLNALLFVTFGVYFYRDLLPLSTYTQIPMDLSEGSILWAKIIMLFATGVVIPLVVPRHYIPVDLKNPMANPNREQTASILSLAVYAFMDPVVLLANRIPHLQHDQLPPLADYDHAKYLKQNSFSVIDKFSGGSERHIFFGFMQIFRREYLVQAMMLIIHVLAKFASPLGINRLLHYLESNGEEPTMKPWFWIAWLFLGPSISTIAFHWYTFVAMRTLIQVECIITQLMFEHSLRIRVKTEVTQSCVGVDNDIHLVTPPPDSNSISSEATSTGSITGVESGGRSQSEASQPTSSRTQDTVTEKGKALHTTGDNLIGKINNLASTDLGNIMEARDFLFLIFYIPLQLVLCIFFLYAVLGWSVFVGLAVMALLFPILGYVGKRMRVIQSSRMKEADARIQTVTETMTLLRMVKMFGWEQKMSQKVAQKRERELLWVWKYQILTLIGDTSNLLIPTVAMVVTYAIYTVIMQQRLTTSTVFSSIVVFALLRKQLFLAFPVISKAIIGKVSLDRVNDFLKNTELLDTMLKTNSTELVSENTPPHNSIIGVREAVFTWSNSGHNASPSTISKRKFSLKIHDEVVFKRGAINLIVGPTGSGKTSLLMALLGEMHYTPSSTTAWMNLPRDSGIAYAAQELWVQNETIKENIVFGTPFEEERYKKVLYQCCLDRDLALFEAGDETEVGERGLTLSGGQKARITLARAIYSHAEIILLDDVLAALDVHTAKWIVDKCFNGDLVRGRTTLLVTHNVAITRSIADYVVSMGIDGSILSQGSITEALEKDEALAQEALKDQEILEDITVEIDPPSLTTQLPKYGKLVVTEEIEEGHISWTALKLYFVGLGGDRPLLFFVSFICGLLVVTVLDVFQTWYLGHWASQYQDHTPSEVAVAYYFSIYGSLVVGGVILYCCCYIYYSFGLIKASRSIHTQLVESVLGTTLRWLDVTPTSRVITRCTQDIRTVDGPIALELWSLIKLSWMMFMQLSAIIFFSPAFLGPSLFVAILGVWLGQLYIAAQLSVKRELSNAKSPVLGHFGAAISGLVSIRAYGAQERFIQGSIDRINRYTRADRTLNNLNRWIGTRIDVMSSLFVATLATYLVYFKGPGPATTGFSLTMAAEFSGLVLWWVRVVNDFEVEGNSLERIQKYLSIEQEPKATDIGIPPAYWPASGNLRVENLSAKYSPDGPDVLHDVSFEIKSGERVGVVGRTGSGKSSLTLSLLRCIFTKGQVYYDGVQTSSVNLDALRSNITMIPQIPELLDGSVRQNLDPFDQYEDATMNDALRAAGLFSLQSGLEEDKISLDTFVSGGGNNFSVGQRQILALARAIVRGSKLLIMDEATSAIDYKTDAVIQSFLRHELNSDVTLITVAHRLQTIMDADKIMVLDAGRIVEFDSPQTLLQVENGKLRALVDESADKDILYSMTQGKK